MTFLRDIGQNVVLSVPLIGAYLIFALGIVVIFRASRVLNLAHGAMAMAPAYVFFQLSTRWHVPVLVALAIGVVSGAGLGWLVERFFVRPLAHVSPTAQVVGTVAAFGLILAIVVKIFGTLALHTAHVFPDARIPIGSATLRGGAIGLFVVAVAVAAGLHQLFQRTDAGLAMRAVADSPRAASLMGVNPQQVTSAAWMLGGGTAALAGILLAATTNLHPYTLSLQALPGFVSVLIGGLESLPGALYGGAVVGGLIGIVPVLPGFGKVTGAPQLMLMIISFVVMALRGQRFQGVNVRAEAIGAAGSDAGSRRAALRPGQRVLRGDLMALAIAALLVFPSFPGVSISILGDANVALIYALVGISLVLLTGLVGQISLAQASLVGIGAFVTGRVIGHLPFPANLPIAALAAAGLATVLGFAALRIRGLYLAVATLIFAWMSDAYLFQQSWLVGVGGSASFQIQTLGPQEGFPHFDFAVRRTFYYVALAAVVAVAGSMAILRRSKTGRAFFAVRGSEVAAASLGIDVTRYKLLAFAMSGAIAGIAGNLIVAQSGVVFTSQFAFTVSLFYLSIAVVGGLSSVGGAIGAGVAFSLLSELFLNVPALSGYLEIVSSGLLIAVLLAYPAGLSGLPSSIRRLAKRFEPTWSVIVARATWSRPTAIARAIQFLGSAGAARFLSRWLPREGTPGPAPGAPGTSDPLGRLMEIAAGSESKPAREPSVSDEPEFAVAGAQDSPLARLAIAAARGFEELPATRPDRAEILSVEGVSMRFGGLYAVRDVSLRVHDFEIVGLIGPNGAGKTTLFNCVSGLLTPTGGRVSLFGKDVSREPVHARTMIGLGRTFQLIQLFPQLTLADNLLVATHAHNPTGVLSHLVMTKEALLAEREARRIVERIIDVFDLRDVADRTVSGLPFGVLRMVELARAIVTGARLIMLDEPASGLDNAETDRLGELLLTLRSALGLTFLLIEHDVRLVTSVSDYIYVLDQGTLLAEGTPTEVQGDPRVIAAYLGGEVVDAVSR